MFISYSLHENNLPNGGNKYRAVVESKATIDLNGVLDQMVARGSIINKAVAQAILHSYYATIEALLLEGFNVKTPQVNFSVSVRGPFENYRDSFDPRRHQVQPAVNPAAPLRRTIRQRAKVRKRETNLPQPILLLYRDHNSGQLDSSVTPGGAGEINGAHLKFDPADSAQGIFFIAADHTVSRVEIIVKNTYSELIFIVPATLAPGAYRLEVRASFGQDELRKTALDEILTVSS